MRPAIAGVNIFSPYEGTELGDYCRKNNLVHKASSQTFFDRRQSRLILPTISNAKLQKLYDSFEYMVYKDWDPVRAKGILWEGRYKKLENIFFFGFFFKKLRQMRITKIAGRKIKRILFNAKVRI